ncbi:MAG: GMP synthase [Candidatus Methanomethylicia archaeon]|nr:GMP synthase [Candidatus Methanomethylicia archaeon]
MREYVGGSKAAIATSGGVDSTTCAVLAHKALGGRLICFFMDTGFMREGEVEEVSEMLRSLGLPLRVLYVRDRFIEALRGKRDAEEKRITFRETFYRVLSEEAKKEMCDVLIQGTIAPDWIETSGGIKTQHNVLEQLGLNTVDRYGFRLLEPLLELYKDQVREVARYLGVRLEASERQPFPGPGLMVRCIGEVREEKLKVLRAATSVVERALGGLRPPPNQYFAAVVEDERSAASHEAERAVREVLPGGRVQYFNCRATGVKGDNRAYGKIAVVSGGKASTEDLFRLPERIIHEDGEVVRAVYELGGEGSGMGGGSTNRYAVLVRAVETRDFMTAKPYNVPMELLERLCRDLLEIKGVSSVCYDITSKPPATVEYE